MSGNSELPSQTLQFACLCRTYWGHIKFPSPDTPRIGILCHCFACRHTSGGLCSSVISKSTTPFTIEFDGRGRRQTRISSRWPDFTGSNFCGECGSALFWINESGHLAIHTGILEDPNGTIEFQRQCCTSQIEDGGLSAWLDLPVDYSCLLNESLREFLQKSATRSSRQQPTQEPEIQAYCCCQDIHFKITAPNMSSTSVSAPYSDLIVPYHSGPSTNSADEKWWLRANGTKYFAGTCACRSCRLASGNDIQAWAFVPKVNIRKLNGEPFDFSTTKQYESSKGVYRNFCGTCGATVFWHDEERPGLIDVAVGLLDAESGARAEELLEWATERVSFQEDAQNKHLIAKLGRGMKAWAKAKTPTNTQAAPEQ